MKLPVSRVQSIFSKFTDLNGYQKSFTLDSCSRQLLLFVSMYLPHLDISYKTKGLQKVHKIQNQKVSLFWCKMSFNPCAVFSQHTAIKFLKSLNCTDLENFSSKINIFKC